MPAQRPVPRWTRKPSTQIGRSLAGKPPTTVGLSPRDHDGVQPRMHYDVQRYRSQPPDNTRRAQITVTDHAKKNGFLTSRGMPQSMASTTSYPQRVGQTKKQLRTPSGPTPAGEPLKSYRHAGLPCGYVAQWGQPLPTSRRVLKPHAYHNVVSACVKRSVSPDCQKLGIFFGPQPDDAIPLIDYLSQCRHPILPRMPRPSYVGIRYFLSNRFFVRVAWSAGR